MPQGCPGGDWGWSRDGGRCWGCCGVSRGKRGKAGPGGMSKDSLAHTLRLYQKVIQTGSPDNVPTPLQIGKWGKGQNQRREPSWASQPVIFNSSFINKYLLSSYYLPGTVLDVVVIAVTKADPPESAHFSPLSFPHPPTSEQLPPWFPFFLSSQTVPTRSQREPVNT